MPSVLLASVFGPYGVDDAFGRKENVMELFHNQVTREQGMFSLRFNHQSFGLHFLAENVGAPVKVLDFPSEERFVREIRKGYDFVGISFIVPNFLKAKRMAELVRLHAPRSRILLGGHGTSIPGIEDMIEHDEICRGEGVQWLRRLLGEDTDRPFRHPALASGFSKRILGIPLRTSSSVLIPGVGCPNACRFCATSHFFGKTYTPYFDTGRDLFEVCREIERKTGYRDFFVMDENFLKRPERARELLRLMEESGRLYRFGIFSSAETVASLGVEFLARLGVYFLWVGVESAKEVFEKNRGIDLKAMIRSLRDHGVSVLASGILFLEHHDETNIWDDIRFLASLEPDMIQFMQLGPVPVTALYRDYEARGLLLDEVPFEERHGQHRIWFRHPKFSPEASERILREAFRYDYDTLGSTLLRMAETMLRGYRTLSAHADPLLRERSRYFRKGAEGFQPALGTLLRHAHNEPVRERTERLIEEYRRTLGPLTLGQRALSVAVRLFAAREAKRAAAGKAVYQPRTIETRYRMSVRDLVAERLKGKTPWAGLDVCVAWGKGIVRVELGGQIDRVSARALLRKVSTCLKSRTESVVLVLDRIQAVEGPSLAKLLGGLRAYRDRLKVEFRGGSEAVGAALAALPPTLASLMIHIT